ncbi:4Fe-4S dicluster protein [Sphaerotilus hippei]|uniref:4Fe-4S dicluster protein n=1 Tax=Sphaerotilus hippei TaxID=744406 RepID=A0A318H209_9BURK|nr:4Fe-4S dicluster domain-containing protein [Sphaerotilus hippei]PXW97418.1 4Fe-4S dicluster protein [Sphaerotilus hippei]
MTASPPGLPRPVADPMTAGPPGAADPAASRRSGRLPSIDPDRCTGCGWCVASCEPHLLSLETVRWKKSAVLDEPQRCTGCSDCAVKCPFRAITMRRPATAGPPG